jgi:hypothetical protein
MKLTSIIVLFWLPVLPAHHQNKAVIQFNISGLLNARPVSTLTNNHLITWTKGIDGGGNGDGYLTQSAALFNGDKTPHALPDNPLIAANESHPAVQLNYSNADSVHNQAYALAGEGKFQFNTAKAKYAAVYLALTSSEGASALKVTLTYTDGTEVKDLVLPDYYADLSPTEPDFSYLAHDLAKWGPKNNMTEKDHHNIDLLNVHPNPAKTLRSISVSKSKAGYLVFWAAAGVKA